MMSPPISSMRRAVAGLLVAAVAAVLRMDDVRMPQRARQLDGVGRASTSSTSRISSTQSFGMSSNVACSVFSAL